MLSVHPAEIQHNSLPPIPLQLQHPPYYTNFLTFPFTGRPMPHRESVSPTDEVLSFSSGMSSPTQQHFAKPRHQQDAAVAQALEIARESPDGAQDPTVSKILENALSDIWSRVETEPDSYVMSRDEFAVFNFFQHRFVGNSMAVSARKRYWDHLHA